MLHGAASGDSFMKKVSILMYHQVGRFPPPAAHRASFCHIRRFKAQMAYLHRFRYKVIGLEKALRGLFGEEPMPEHSVVLTFDDGCENFRDYALPVLKKYRFPATLFLVSSLVGKRAEWLEGRAQAPPKLMDRETLLLLKGEDIVFGSHTRSHSSLTALNLLSMREEIVQSKADLEHLLGEEVKYFCYPNGEFDEQVVATVRDAGYEAALTCERASATPFDDRFALPRKAISYGDSLLGYFWKLHMKHRRKTRR